MAIDFDAATDAATKATGTLQLQPGLTRAIVDTDPFNPPRYETPLPGFVVRMSQECKELVDRLAKLVAFMDDSPLRFKGLPVLEQQLLHEQRTAMEQYAKTLSLRYHLALRAAGRD